MEDASAGITAPHEGVTVAVEPVTAAAVSISALSPAPERDATESILVLSRDQALVESMRAGSLAHALVVVADESEFASRLLGAHAGVAMIDAASVNGGIVTLVDRLHAQFPDLVLIVAGSANDQAEVAAKVTDGTVHRFLHKPVSAQRIKLFVEAAWRRHDEEHLAATRSMKQLSEAPPPQKRAQLPIILAAAAAVALAVGLWIAYRPSARAPQAAAPMKAAPSAAPAQSAALDKLLNDAEKALLAGQVDEAGTLVDSARKLQPDNVRVVFLDAQIAKERERALLAQARQAAAGGNLAGALAVLDGAARDGRKSATVSETRNELEQKQIDDRVKAFLRQADNRIASGALIEPAQNNARFYIESARALAPSDPGIARAQQSLGDRIVEQARQAISAGKADDADRLLDAAQQPYVDAATNASLKRDTQRMKVSGAADNVTRIMTAFNDRMARGALIDPQGDSAKFWLAELSKAAADHPATLLARQSFSARLLSAASDAAGRRETEAARAWLAEARAAGATPDDLARIERVIAQPPQSSGGSAVAPGAAAADSEGTVVQASMLKRLRYVEPRFPPDAERDGLSGWVDLEFQVLPTGKIGNVTVVSSQPAKAFDGAAVEALKRWQFEPVVRDGQVVTQRARVRIRFQAG